MGKKTNKLIYVILGILAILFGALVPFDIIRRKQFLAEGDRAMADFCFQTGIFEFIFCIILCGIIFLLVIKDTPFSELCVHGKQTNKCTLQVADIYFIIKCNNRDFGRPS